MRDFGRAKFGSLDQVPTSSWSGHRLDLKLEYAKNELILFGHTQTAVGAITTALSAGATPTSPIHYKLAVQGRAAVGTVTRGGAKTGILGLLGSDGVSEVFAWISVDGKKIEILEEPRGAGRRYALSSS
jgi:hypothetical protein